MKKLISILLSFLLIFNIIEYNQAFNVIALEVTKQNGGQADVSNNAPAREMVAKEFLPLLGNLLGVTAKNVFYLVWGGMQLFGRICFNGDFSDLEKWWTYWWEGNQSQIQFVSKGNQKNGREADISNSASKSETDVTNGASETEMVVKEFLPLSYNWLTVTGKNIGWLCFKAVKSLLTAPARVFLASDELFTGALSSEISLCRNDENCAKELERVIEENKKLKMCLKNKNCEKELERVLEVIGPNRQVSVKTAIETCLSDEICKEEFEKVTAQS